MSQPPAPPSGPPPGQPGPPGPPGPPPAWRPVADPPPGRRGPVLALVAVALAVLLVGGVLTAVLLTTGGDDADPDREETRGTADPSTAATEESPASAGVSAEERESLLQTSRASLETILSYSHATYDRDLAEARELMTQSGAQRFAQTAEPLRDTVRSTRATVTTTVEQVGVVAAEADRAQVLAFLEQEASRGGTRNGVTRTSARANLVREGDRWLVDRLITGGSQPPPAEQDEAPAAVLRVASGFGRAVVNLDHRTPEEDREELRPLCTEQMLVTYDDFRSTLRRDRVSQTGTVNAAALVSMDDERAVALVDAGTTVSRQGTKQTYEQQLRLVVDLVRRDDRWLVDDFDPGS